MTEAHESTFAPGDEVRVSLPDPDGPDAQYDGRKATVKSVEFDELGDGAGEPELNEMYTLEFENGDTPGLSFRVHDLESTEG